MAEPRWLAADEIHSWRPIAAVLLLLPSHFEEALQPHGLTLFDYLMLVVLHDAPDRTLPMSGLAHLANGSLSRTSHGARRLEQRDLLRRHRCPDDGRVTLVTLTDRGAERLVEAAPDHVESVRAAIFDVLSAGEAAELGRLTTLVLRALHPTGPWAEDPPPPG